MSRLPLFRFLLPALALPVAAWAAAAAPPGAAVVPGVPLDDTTFQKEVLPLLKTHCYDCHGDGEAKGGVQLDKFGSAAALHDPVLWQRVLKNVRAGLMPPADEPRLASADVDRLAQWIKSEAFRLNPTNLDPGRTTVRRLNRVEYRNTIRDLLGFDFDTAKEFPADDSGHGFDNLADVLTVSPLLIEKYLEAAQTIVAAAVPLKAKLMPERMIAGKEFKVVAPKPAAAQPIGILPVVSGSALDFSYYHPASASFSQTVAYAGKYQITFDFQTLETADRGTPADANRCRLILKCDGETLLDQEFTREADGRAYTFPLERKLASGAHQLSVEIQPAATTFPQTRQLRLSLRAMTLRGPVDDERFWIATKGYEKYFPRAVPFAVELTLRRQYAREILNRFAARAFRRPLEPDALDRLVALAESVYTQPKLTFEEGVAQAMVAVLVSPRFLFREETAEPLASGETYPLVDEFTLASRLSYFLWSSMPDEELFGLANTRRLRASLPAQISRMLKDPRADEFVANFTGQWLQGRDVASIPLDASAIFLREHPGASATGSTPPALTDELRTAMRQETEMVFAHIVRNDRSLLELIESNYTFLNEPLARHYGIEGVNGPKMRQVTLPSGSPRGGILTQGTVLAVTSNPTRTSPVKRGLFILDAILGTPPAPPPPNIPALEDAATPEQLSKLTLRETLALHAKGTTCYSCHSRMDPLGLALENFNALGVWRTSEAGQPITPAGQLITGEKFKDVRELKRILATVRQRDFYYCLSEKLLTYALGRGVEYYDTETLDQMVAQLEATGGKPSALLTVIVNSPAFQKRRPLKSAVGG